jgi:hypothetical protein
MVGANTPKNNITCIRMKHYVYCLWFAHVSRLYFIDTASWHVQKGDSRGEYRHSPRHSSHPVTSSRSLKLIVVPRPISLSHASRTDTCGPLCLCSSHATPQKERRPNQPSSGDQLQGIRRLPPILPLWRLYLASRSRCSEKPARCVFIPHLCIPKNIANPPHQKQQLQTQNATVPNP